MESLGVILLDCYKRLGDASCAGVHGEQALQCSRGRVGGSVAQADLCEPAQRAEVAWFEFKRVKNVADAILLSRWAAM